MADRGADRAPESDDLVARIDALTARLAEQEAEIARLKVGTTRAATAPVAQKVGRRGMLSKALGAAVAAAAPGLAQRTSTAEATANTTVVGASTAQYGLLASPGTAGAPIPPTIGFTTHGVIGSNTEVTVLPVSSGVAGARNGVSTSGVVGANGGAGFGVYGVAQASGIGVYGTCQSGFGMVGSSPTGVGVFGDSDVGEAIFGYSKSKFGVRARSDTSTALYAESASGIGIRGIAGANVGILGQSTTSVGVYGYAVSGAGVVGETTSGLAGHFLGNVVVSGTLTAASKSALVTTSDGTQRRLYCMEAPEAVFEDFGRGELVNGVGRVQIDKEFAGLVRMDDYDVYLTPYGECRGLYVSARWSGEFEVREVGGGTTSLPFGFRLVAARKDAPGTRLERIEPQRRPSANVQDAPPPTRLPAVGDRTPRSNNVRRGANGSDD